MAEDNTVHSIHIIMHNILEDAVAYARPMLNFKWAYCVSLLLLLLFNIYSYHMYNTYSAHMCRSTQTRTHRPSPFSSSDGTSIQLNVTFMRLTLPHTHTYKHTLTLSNSNKNCFKYYYNINVIQLIPWLTHIYLYEPKYHNMIQMWITITTDRKKATNSITCEDTKEAKKRSKFLGAQLFFHLDSRCSSWCLMFCDVNVYKQIYYLYYHFQSKNEQMLCIL